jgi:TIR domain-containing protein
MADRAKLFLSHTWKDDQPFVALLFDDLRKRGYDAWMNILNMPSRGRSLPQEVLYNLDEAEQVYALSIGKVILIARRRTLPAVGPKSHREGKHG